MNSNAKVGLLGIFFIIAIFITANYLNIISFKEKGYILKIKFKNISTLTKSADVKFSGLTIGRVKDFKITPDNKILVITLIYKKYHIPKDSIFNINSSVMGNSWIEISPSNKEEYYKNGDIIEGKPQYTLQDLLKDTKTLLSTTQETLDKINNILSDPEFFPELKKDVKKLGAALDTITYQVNRLADQSSEAIYVVKHDLHILLTNLDYRIDKISNEVYALSHNLNVMTIENKKDIRKIVKNIKASSKDLKSTMHYVKEFVSDKEIKDEIKSSIKHINKSAKRLNHIAKEVDEFVSDKEMKQDLKDAIKYTKETMQTISEFLSPLNKRNKKKKGYKLTNWQLESEWVYKERGPIMNLNLKLFPYNNRFYLIGIRDIGYRNEWNLQIGNRFGKSSAYRVGILESKVGFGYDYYSQKDKNLLYRIDFYDPKYPTINFFTYFTLNKYLKLKLGVRDILHKAGRKPTVSIFSEF